MCNSIKLNMVIEMPAGTKATKVNLIEKGTSIDVFYSIFETLPNPDIPEFDFNRKFPIIEASKLSLQDEFLKHEAKTDRQRWLKETLTNAIKAGLKDFRRPAMDPSFKDNKIVYEAGLMPKDKWYCGCWFSSAKEFMPERNSRLGTSSEYTAFLGILIKQLINEMGYTVCQAWEAVCDDSKDLGHYWNSDKSKYELEPTGSRPIGLFYDLANTCKILSHNNDSEFLFAGGRCINDSFGCPLANMVVANIADYHLCTHSVGWLVMDV